MAKAKKHFSYTIKDFYKRYAGRRKEDQEVIPYAEYRTVMEDLFMELQKAVIYDQLIWIMPYSLGRTFIKSKKNANISKSKSAIDFQKTKKYGKVIRHLNLHTNGYYFMFFWDKSYTRLRNKSYYTYSAIESQKATRLGIGKKGLSRHIIALSKDPQKRSYIRI